MQTLQNENPELYNLDSDVAETTDLSTDEPERLANMMQRLRQYTHEVEAEAPDWWKNQSYRKKKKKPTRNTPSAKQSQKTAFIPAIHRKKTSVVLTAAPRTKQKAAEPEKQEDYSQYALFLDTAERPPACEAERTSLPLQLKRGDHICLIGNTLFELMDVGSAALIADEIRNTIDNFEPRVQLIDVEVKPYYDSHIYDVTIIYEIVGISVPAQQVNFVLESLR